MKSRTGLFGPPRHVWRWTTLVGLALGTSLACADSPTTALLGAVERLLQDQQARHREATEWQAQQATMTHGIELLEKEKTLLETRLAEAEQAVDDQSADRIAWEQTRAAQERAVQQITPHLDALERALPALLRTQPEFVEIAPADGRTTIERLRYVLAAAAEIHRHDQTWTHTRRLMEVPDAGRLQLDLLYIGLAQVYAVSLDDRIAGHGVWTGDAWHWTWNPAWARLVRPALRVHQGNLTPQWLTLPIARVEEGATP